MYRHRLKLRVYQKAILLIIAFSINTIQAQSQLSTISSAKSLGQGGTGSTITGISSLLSNPSGVYSLESISISTNYYMPYMISKLSNQSLSIATPVKFGIPYASINRFGFEKYNETILSVGFTKQLAPVFSMNFQFNLQQNQTIESGSATQAYSSLGVQFQPHKQLIAAFNISNPEKASIKIQEETETISSQYNFGIRWLASSNFSIACEIQKQTNYETTTCFGCEYVLNQIITTRIGAYGKPMNYTLGIALKINNLSIDACAINHQTLGVSSGLGLTYYFNQKQ